MNRTAIEWCDMTWNPVTGCYHNCPYCYARKIVRRFGGESPTNYGLSAGRVHNIGKAEAHDYITPYPYGFDPTFHQIRLDEPQKIKKPQNIFVCSMADLFGDWVPDEWIESIFEACKKAPQHRYLFLTKNMDGYTRLFGQNIPENIWLGYSVNEALQNKHLGYWKKRMFLSVEPLHKPFNDFNASLFDWVIIGAETGNRKGKVIPKREWIRDILSQCYDRGIPIFMKDSLEEIWGEPLVQEYPWEKGVKNGK